MRAYQWSTGLALGGLSLGGALSVSLALAIRSHAAERRRMEVELRRNERLAALGTLISGVAHELRNPLAGLRSTAQLWRKGAVTDSEMAADLVDEVDRLDAIVGQLLTFTRLEDRAREVVDLNALAAEAARLARPRAEAGRVRVDSEVAATPLPVEVEAHGVMQALRNLTTNALQAMPDGGVLAIRASRDASGGMARVSVADTGPGLDDAAAHHLFEPFFTTRAEGTGLGLAIAREIVLAHRGEIRAANRRGGGAEFVISLPIREGDSR